MIFVFYTCMCSSEIQTETMTNSVFRDNIFRERTVRFWFKKLQIETSFKESIRKIKQNHQFKIKI